jgi:hypothetical protein
MVFSAYTRVSLGCVEITSSPISALPDKDYLTVRCEIVVSRQNFTVCRDWMETCHVVQTPGYDWTIPPPILSSARQLFYHV